MTDGPDTPDGGFGRRLDRSEVHIEVVDPQSDEALLAMTRYFAELDQRFPGGFDPGDALEADAPGFRPPAGVFLVGMPGSMPGSSEASSVVACGGVQVLPDGPAEIKRMWVSEQWRGAGLGKRMLQQLEHHARELGNGVIRLDTNSVLTTAIAMYQRAGYREIPRYNDNPFAKHWFEKMPDA